MAVFWVVAPCSLVEVYQRFRRPCYLHRQDLWSVGKLLPNYTELQTRRQPSSYSPPWEPQILQWQQRHQWYPSLPLLQCDNITAHAQRITGNGVILVPHHELELPSRGCYRVYEIKIWEFEVVSGGFTSIPRFMTIRPVILELLCEYRRTSMLTSRTMKPSGQQRK
jgi:hypothetical protein